MSLKVDAVVIGASITGATTACLLHDAGYRVCLIDPVALHPARTDSYDLRTYALTPASMRVLATLGVWQKLDAQRICAYTGMQVWDGEGLGQIAFSSGELGRTALGYIVEHANLMFALDDKIKRSAPIATRIARLEHLRCSETACVVTLDNAERISAPLVLACDGAASRVRELAEIPTVSHDYRQCAIVCNVETELPHENIARQRFLAAGPLAFLPLPLAHLSSIVWTTTVAQAAWAKEASDEVFCAALAGAFDLRLGRVMTTTRRLVFPLQRLHADRYIATRVALVGDAAHVVHPLAGQGLNLGLMDAAALVETLTRICSSDLAYPQPALRRYERWRRGENLLLLQLTDKLNRLFGLTHPAAKWLRGFGLNATNQLPFVKHWLAVRAMGDAGDLPAIARPTALV